VQRLDLQREIVRHRRAIGLVLRIPVVAEGFARRVEHDGEVIRLAVEHYSAQHRNDTAQRTGRLAARRAKVRQRVIRAIQVR